ncbi:DMT family transporter [Crassaminicella profunda]|uniref:DMT family transporter n=1 Tax=Crassaminicella profunda TaxID=1286698 RepID=UPI001CA725AE|nr:DMT family transporter [Crassaminicella profunda]QZY56427.1 DMT family transporter [Crassaminicella profunda]
MYIVLAFTTGFSIIFATILNGKLAQKIGVANGVMLNYLMGLLASVILCFMVRDNIPSFQVFSSIPWYYFLGGFIGVAVVFLFNITVPQIPAVYIVILPFIGQILTSSVIDYFYLDIFSKGKIIGGLLFLVGLIYNASVDKKYQNLNLDFEDQ